MDLAVPVENAKSPKQFGLLGAFFWLNFQRSKDLAMVASFDLLEIDDPNQ